MPELIESPVASKPLLLLVSLGWVHGGAETYYTKLAAILSKRFRMVAIVCAQRLAEELSDICDDVVLLRQNSNRYVSALRAFIALRKRFPIEAAHLNGQPESYLAPFLKVFGLKILSTRHTPYTDEFMREGSRMPVVVKRMMVQLAFWCTGRVICVSRMIEKQVAHVLPAARLKFIPTWIDAAFEREMERPLPIQTDRQPVKLIFAGRVVENKGIFDILEAMKGCPGVHLTVVGDGSQRNALENLATELHLQPHAKFTGRVEHAEIGRHYSASDIYLNASKIDNQPLSILEAFACGLPVVTTDAGGIPDIVTDENTGFLVPVGDYQGLAARALKLLEDQSIATKMTELARLECTRYTWPVVCPQWLDLYHSVAKK